MFLHVPCLEYDKYPYEKRCIIPADQGSPVPG
jgi:hypothetical protein